ncbi:hypothetical protein BS47DRAFT_1398379 [Hydnum rufescens UP504]|uniref:Uncharacterized protein n=1 Tax=Hydnum rufescens UP504 TaxID=1448309 RepID=A0A9P6AKU7_9AGAM|nr:hypothetical protein BS47DRAFT_1398379 [Hydnum rufescens UP504]
MYKDRPRCHPQAARSAAARAVLITGFPRPPSPLALPLRSRAPTANEVPPLNVSMPPLLTVSTPSLVNASIPPAPGSQPFQPGPTSLVSDAPSALHAWGDPGQPVLLEETWMRRECVGSVYLHIGAFESAIDFVLRVRYTLLVQGSTKRPARQSSLEDAFFVFRSFTQGSYPPAMAMPYYPPIFFDATPDQFRRRQVMPPILGSDSDHPAPTSLPPNAYPPPVLLAAGPVSRLRESLWLTRNPNRMFLQHWHHDPDLPRFLFTTIPTIREINTDSLGRHRRDRQKRQQGRKHYESKVPPAGSPKRYILRESSTTTTTIRTLAAETSSSACERPRLTKYLHSIVSMPPLLTVSTPSLVNASIPPARVLSRDLFLVLKYLGSEISRHMASFQPGPTSLVSDALALFTHGGSRPNQFVGENLDAPNIYSTTSDADLDAYSTRAYWPSHHRVTPSVQGSVKISARRFSFEDDFFVFVHLLRFDEGGTAKLAPTSYAVDSYQRNSDNPTPSLLPPNAHPPPVVPAPVVPHVSPPTPEPVTVPPPGSPLHSPIALIRHGIERYAQRSSPDHDSDSDFYAYSRPYRPDTSARRPRATSSAQQDPNSLRTAPPPVQRADSDSDSYSQPPPHFSEITPCSLEVAVMPRPQNTRSGHAPKRALSTRIASPFLLYKPMLALRLGNQSITVPASQASTPLSLLMYIHLRFPNQSITVPASQAFRFYILDAREMFRGVAGILGTGALDDGAIILILCRRR